MVGSCPTQPELQDVASAGRMGKHSHKRLDFLRAGAALEYEPFSHDNI